MVAIGGNEFQFAEYSLAHSWSEKGTFTVVGIGKGFVEVDVKATRKLVTDLKEYPDREIVRKEIWRITEGGDFQRCFPKNPDTKDRSKEFKTAPDDGLFLLTFKKGEPKDRE
jgi:hypothetical protein